MVGGISPLGQRKRLPMVIDSSALGLEAMYVGAGRRGLELALRPADLIRLCAATTSAIARYCGVDECWKHQVDPAVQPM